MLVETGLNQTDFGTAATLTALFLTPFFFIRSGMNVSMPAVRANLGLSMPSVTTMAAEVLDEVLARRAVPGRPADLAFIRAAAGRGGHPDPRLPIVG